MNKKCKRIISSVLSFTMILGCMVFNDVGVIQAAETKIAEYDFNTGDSGYLSAPAGIVNITGTTVTTGEVDETADLTVNESGGSQDAHGFRLNGGNSIILRNIRGASDETLPVKVTIGGCSWGSTFTVTDGDSFEKSGLTNKIGGCWHSNKTANVFNIYYNGEKSVLKMTAAGQIYIPYLKVSTVSEEEYKAAIIPSSVTLSGTDTIAVGSETQLSAALAPTNVYPFIDTLKWSSSDETVAEVNENGVVTGKGIGSTEITAASSENADIKGTMTVNVVDPNTKYVVKGEISGVASDKVTSVKIGDTDAVIDEASFTYTAEVVPGKYTVSANAVDGYTLSSLSTAELTVSGDTTRNIHYKKNVVAATDTTVYVDGSENGANHYDTITQAVAGLKAGNKTSGATVVLTAGEIYEEQVIVDVPKVKFYCEDSTNLPTVQWYYGIGQTYYSADSTGYYNEERAYDKTQKGKVDRWGCAVRVTASGFSAENVIFKNTFNYNVTQAELDDGVTRDASAYGENTGGIARTDLAQDVQTTAATERAAAIALDGSNAAFENCQFLGSQDTIYSGGNAYFKNCLIAGQTDYMFNNSGTVIVDDSVLQWKGYSGTPKAGYITAARGKYIFRNCEITGSDTLSVTPGYYGRPWGTSADVSFIGCKTNGLIVDAGWTSMSGVAPDASMFKENSNTTDGTKAFNSALNAADSEIGTDNDPKEDYIYFKETWVPFNHVAYKSSESGSTVTATWDFQNGSPESIKDTNIQGVDANGTVASDVDGVSLGVEAAEAGTNIKLQYNASGYAQFNQNTLIKVPVKTTSDTVTVVSYPGQYKYTVGGTAASANETVYTATADDVAQGYVAVVATGTAYLYSITLVTNEAGSSIVLGDVNKDGVIDADDAAAIIRLVATLSGDYDTDAADADGNGNIELLDAIFYLQNLPVTTA
ncbi:MAG: Ig-like domain-containing protein [Firmicutes bacterium]|nr:Ig-like domain-containing protein [Bacillota bacterium]